MGGFADLSASSDWAGHWKAEADVGVSRSWGSVFANAWMTPDQVGGGVGVRF